MPGGISEYPLGSSTVGSFYGLMGWMFKWFSGFGYARGPFRIQAAEVFTPGGGAAEIFAAGKSQTAIFVPGIAATEVTNS